MRDCWVGKAQDSCQCPSSSARMSEAVCTGFATWTSRGLQYAWAIVAGALPSLSGAFAVAMDGLRPVPDERYRHMVAALVADIQGSRP